MGKDYLGADMRRAGKGADDKEEEKEFKALDEGDITLLKTYGQGQYSKPLKQVGKQLTLYHFISDKKLSHSSFVKRCKWPVLSICTYNKDSSNSTSALFFQHFA